MKSGDELSVRSPSPTAYANSSRSDVLRRPPLRCTRVDDNATTPTTTTASLPPAFLIPSNNAIYSNTLSCVAVEFIFSEHEEHTCIRTSVVRVRRRRRCRRRRRRTYVLRTYKQDGRTDTHTCVSTLALCTVIAHAKKHRTAEMPITTRTVTTSRHRSAHTRAHARVARVAGAHGQTWPTSV